MTLVTKAEYARLHGVSKPAVQKWASKGYLTFVDGRVDVEASDARLRAARMGRFRDGAGSAPDPVEPTKVEAAPRRAPVGKEPSQQAAKATAPDLPDEESVATIEAFLRRLLDGEYETEAAADRVKANVLAGLRALEFQQKAGSLVEVEVAEGVLFEQFRAARDAWLNWPARVGPLVAADLGVEADAVTEVLTAHVHQHLAQLGEPDADFGGEG